MRAKGGYGVQRARGGTSCIPGHRQRRACLMTVRQPISHAASQPTLCRWQRGQHWSLRHQPSCTVLIIQFRSQCTPSRQIDSNARACASNLVTPAKSAIAQLQCDHNGVKRQRHPRTARGKLGNDRLGPNRPLRQSRFEFFDVHWTMTHKPSHQPNTATSDEIHACFVRKPRSESLKT